MRFLRQRDKFSCGVIAVLNVAKWLGHNDTMASSYKIVRRALQCTPRSGSSRRKLDTFFRMLGCVRLYKPSIGRIDKALIAGHAVVMSSISPDHTEGHAFLVAGRTDKEFLCVNVCRSHEWISRKVFRREFLHRWRGQPKRQGWLYPVAWKVPRGKYIARKAE